MVLPRSVVDASCAATITNIVGTNSTVANSTTTNATSTNLFAGTLAAISGVFGNLNATTSATLSSTTIYGQTILGNLIATSTIATSTFGAAITVGAGQGTSTFAGGLSANTLVVNSRAYFNSSTTFNGVEYLFPSLQGTAGQTLVNDGNGKLTWANASNGGSFFSTTSNNMAVYPTSVGQILVLGASATSTTGNIFEAIGDVLFKGALVVTKGIVASTTDILATSTVYGLSYLYGGAIGSNITATGTLSAGATTTLSGQLLVAGTTTLSNVLSLNSNRIISVATPVSNNDAANKAYVDSLVQGLSWKAPVKSFATTTIVSSTTGRKHAKNLS
jgi:hypothetical protein